MTTDQIGKLACQWDRRGRLKPSWADIEVLANRYLATDPGSPDATDKWHHLLMAVGNFKRQSGLISPAQLTEVQGDQVGRPDRITIPGGRGEADVERCAPATWRHLTKKIPGLSVPPASTLLSALWPDYHVIIDWNDRDAAVGLDAAALLCAEEMDSGWFKSGKPSEREPYWELYDWFRTTVVDTARSRTEPTSPVRPRDVERALFVLGRDTATFRRTPEWTWSGYHDLLKERLTNLQA